MITSCPNCGGALAQVDTTSRPDTAPWLCATCSLGLWNAELTTAARRGWDPATRHNQERSVRAAAKAEHQGAQAHGGGGQ